MNEDPGVPGVVQRFFDNRANVPPERLVEYAGRYVAWSLDGARLLAAAESEEELRRTLEEQAINPSFVVYEFLEPPEVTSDDKVTR
jgi:hypothetical protein